jgi:hypothetical protein
MVLVAEDTVEDREASPGSTARRGPHRSEDTRRPGRAPRGQAGGLDATFTAPPPQMIASRPFANNDGEALKLGAASSWLFQSLGQNLPQTGRRRNRDTVRPSSAYPGGFVCVASSADSSLVARPIRSYARSVQTTQSHTMLWSGAVVTAFAAVFFPHLEAVKNEDRPIWEFWPHDREGIILVPIVIALTLALFALLGGWAWRTTAPGNRAARVGLICAILGLVGVLAFWLSVPIILGGLGLTLGLEGRRRAATDGSGRQALAAIIIGAIAFVVGTGFWVLA